MQRFGRHSRNAVVPATTPLAVSRSYSREKQSTVSTDIDTKLIDNSLNISTANGTLRSYTAKQTYLCDNDYDGDIVLHQPPTWYVQSKSQLPVPMPPLTPTSSSHLGRYKINQDSVTVNNDDVFGSSSNHGIQNKFYRNTAPIDSNSNVPYDDNYFNNAYISAYPKECAMQGVPIQSMNTNAIPIINDSNIKYNTANTIGIEQSTQQQQQQAQHNLLTPNITSAYDTNAKFHSLYQSNANQFTPTNVTHNFNFPIYGVTVPFKKKTHRQHRRKVRHLKTKKTDCMLNMCTFTRFMAHSRKAVGNFDSIELCTFQC